MHFQLPLIPPTASELLVHSESLPVYKARADVSNRTSASGSSQGPKDRKPVVAEIKSWTGASAIQVNDEPPSKPVAGRKGKASKPTSGSKLRATKASYPAKELTIPTVAERRYPIYRAEGGDIQPPSPGVTVQSFPGNQNHSVSSNQISLKQEQIFLYEGEAQASLPTAVYTDGATIIKTGTRPDVVNNKHDVISGVASSIDVVSAVNLRDYSSAATADVILSRQPELVTSSKAVHHTFTDVIDPAVRKTQSSRTANNTQWPNFTENSSNNSVRTEYEFASFSVTDDAANLTRPSPEMRGEINGRAPGMTRGDVAALSAGCALCLCVCLVLVAAFRYRKRSKEKRKKPVLDDVVNPSLLEEIIRVELARGRVKMYRTAITDTRELERLPLGGPVNDQWGTPTMSAKLHSEIPGASTRHSYRPLFSDSPVRIYDLGQAKWTSADPDLVNVLRPWNTSYGDGSRLSPVRSENLPLKTMSFPGGHTMLALPVDSMQATQDSHVTRSNAPGSDSPTPNCRHSADCKTQSFSTPFAPPDVSHTTVSGQTRCIPNGATVDSHHRKRFPKMGQSCLLNRRSNCSPAVANNVNVPRSSVISTVMTSNVVDSAGTGLYTRPLGCGQTISNPGSTQLETESKQNAGSLFVANGNALSLRQMADEEFAQNEILWRNDTKLLSHLQSSPIYVNTHLPTILSRDTAV